MTISQNKNIILRSNSVRIVPISNSLNDIDTVKQLVIDIISDKTMEGKILRVQGYLINDTEESYVIGGLPLNNIRCPYRKIYRTIKR